MAKSKRKFLLKSLLLLIALFVSLITYALFIEPNQLTVQHELINPTIESQKSLKVLQISDLHIKKIQRVHYRIAEEVKKLNPDIIVFTGDAIDREENVDTLHAFLKLLPAEIQKYTIMGNWEYWTGFDPKAIHTIFEKHNITLLVNETVTYRYNEIDLLITGLDDFLGGMPSLTEAVKGEVPHPNHLVLAHSPADYLKRESLNTITETDSSEYSFKDFNYNATLTGHTHGGQITFFGIPLITPPGSNGYVHGWYGLDYPIYVSKGVGSSVIPMRFMAKPEITLFEWRLR